MVTTTDDIEAPASTEVAEQEPPPGWGSDDQISFSKDEGKYLLTEDDGSEMEWNTKYKAWMPVVYEDEMAAQQSAYSVAGVDDSAPIERPKKRKKKDFENGNSEKRAKQDANNQSEDRPKRERHPIAVYVSNLPFDVSAAELQEYFAKCGMIAEDASGQKRVKMYYDEDGKFKGDALVTYFKPESVPLALQMLDETNLPRADGRPSPLIRVQLAEWKSEDAEQTQSQKEAKRKTADEVRRLQRRRQKLESKLADWDDDDYPQQTHGRWAKVVILRHMFTLQELEEDLAALIELKEDVRDECDKIGEVTNVVLFDGEEDGIMSVRFANEEDAFNCVTKMNGRYFSGRRIEAEIYDGKVRYKKAKGGDAGDEEENEQMRLEKFGAWLEDGNDG